MVGTSRKRQAKQNRNRYTQKTDNQMVKPVRINRTQTSIQINDVSKFIISDLKWSAIATGIVVAVLVILYILFH
jgi:hypothetical protein